MLAYCCESCDNRVYGEKGSKSYVIKTYKLKPLVWLRPDLVFENSELRPLKVARLDSGSGDSSDADGGGDDEGDAEAFLVQLRGSLLKHLFSCLSPHHARRLEFLELSHALERSLRNTDPHGNQET